jgi:hypothetical protein
MHAVARMMIRPTSESEWPRGTIVHVYCIGRKDTATPTLSRVHTQHSPAVTGSELHNTVSPARFGCNLHVNG